MKKLMLVMAALIAVPAMAAVDFDVVNNGDGTVTISYTTTDGDLPRGLALNLLCENATIDSVESWGCFNVCLDYAFDNSEGYVVGDPDQTPIADPTGPGVGTLPAAEVSVCMGYLDEDGDETLGEPGPAECTDVITIAYSTTATPATLTVSADTLRGPDSGVVGSELASDLPITIDLDGGPPPCIGDFNASNSITSTDISLLVNYWLTYKNFLGIAPIGEEGYVQGMDLNNSNSITSTDISLVVNWWLSEKNFLGIAPCMPAS